MDNPWRTISQNTIYENPHGFRLREDSVINPSGQPSTYMVLECREVVTIVGITPDQDAIFVHQWRYPIEMALLELPAGHVETAEDPFTAAKREFLEEVGGVSQDWYYLTSLWVSVGATRTRNHFFLAVDANLSQPPKLDADESLTLRLIPLRQALYLASAGHLKDEKTVAALFMAQFHLAYTLGS